MRSACFALVGMSDRLETAEQRTDFGLGRGYGW
jgi:hypothetical protein